MMAAGIFNGKRAGVGKRLEFHPSRSVEAPNLSIFTSCLDFHQLRRNGWWNYCPGRPAGADRPGWRLPPLDRSIRFRLAAPGRPVLAGGSRRAGLGRPFAENPGPAIAVPPRGPSMAGPAILGGGLGPFPRAPAFRPVRRGAVVEDRDRARQRPGPSGRDEETEMSAAKRRGSQKRHKPWRPYRRSGEPIPEAQASPFAGFRPDGPDPGPDASGPDASGPDAPGPDAPGAAEDPAVAVQRWLQAAEAGDPAARYNLGVACAEGAGVPRDVAVAVRWWRLAAEAGVPLAQYDLGVGYANGLGVPDRKSTRLNSSHPVESRLPSSA
jgi:hypothetical protein